MSLHENNYAVSMHVVQRNFATELKWVMAAEGVGQAELAERIGVSQSTICRVLKRGYLRRSLARSQIERFLDATALKVHKKRGVPPALESAVQEVWDKTPTHAHILACLIRATRGLVPGANATDNG